MAEGGSKRASKVKTKRNPVRVYVEAGVTLSVTENPPQFLKYLTGVEMIAPNDDLLSIKKTEAKAYELCEELVEKRVKKMGKLIKRVNNERK